MAELRSTASGTGIVSLFANNDPDLLSYRQQHFGTGVMVSVGDWLHIYELQDNRGFWKKPHYTHTKTKSKVCVASSADIPDLIRFVLANLDLGQVRRERLANPMLRDERLELTINELRRVWHERTRKPF